MATATDCPTCLATARGGRIRITESSAEMLEDVLRKGRQIWLVERRKAIDEGDVGKSSIATSEIRQIDVLLEEIARTQAEKGWRTSHGEPERSHS